MSTLLVATSGGHLQELWELRPRLEPLDGDVTWVTVDCAQSRALLAGEQRLFAPAARPRDPGAAMAGLRLARHVLALDRWTDVVSTGSSIAVPFLTLARAQGIRAHFVESAARVAGPSLSGRIVERLPGVRCYSPYDWWDRPGWVYRGSVLDGYGPEPAGGPAAGSGAGQDAAELRSVVVTVGRSGYGFPRLLTRLQAILPRGCEVFWQTGASDLAGTGLERVARAVVTERELVERMAAADLVISHAGVGSALASMRAGRAPLLVPRKADRGEHVDDHQVQIARELERRGLASSCDADDLEPAVLGKAAFGRVGRRNAGPFRLASGRLAGHVRVSRRQTGHERAERRATA
jgi:UDP-N-acetylglucosamine--N-acetylmuramyl-(pentapeptide) pyrophosphoryl-undecaprenol N-acetylglucosamine transferase